mgnify:CR=1 FL=1
MRKATLTVAVVVLLAAVCLAAGFAIEPQSSISPTTPDSPCPAVGCASGECHGFGAVPEPDGINEMTCPEAGCASVECHAWDSLVSRYHQASDASLNLWIIMPTVLVLGIVLVVRALSKGGRREEAK